MDIRIRAVGRTAGLLAIWAIVPMIVLWLFRFLNLDDNTISMIGASILVAVFTWIVYTVVLGQLKWEQACKESSDNITELDKKLSK